jgi:hypothetical protein
MQTITETITSALQSAGYGQYTSYAAPVIEALEARQAEQVEALTAYAQERGVSAEEVRPVFVEAGLVEPMPEPEATLGEDSLSLQAEVSRLGGLVQRLIDAAAARGLRI